MLSPNNFSAKDVPPGQVSAAPDAWPFALHGPGDALGCRAGAALPVGRFWGEVAALAARLPEAGHVVNLCADRYRFMVGFAAALARRQISLMPANSLPATLGGLAETYPDLYVLTDGAPTGLPTLPFPQDLAGAPAPPPALAPEQVAVIQFSSGSTGQPKPVAKRWGTLVASARAAGVRLGVAGLAGATIVGTVPHQHSYGLESVILLALQHRLAVEVATPLYPADVRAALARAPRPRILVTTPVHLRALVAEEGGMPAADLILSATAPLPAALAAAAEACFRAPLLEIYGCTEAGQVAARRTALETGWRCFDGIELSQERGPTGMLTTVSGPPAAGEALLQDEIELTGPGRFRLGARAADLVNVAGKRASLAQLNQTLLAIEGVEDGVVFMPDSTAAVPRLAALVVAPGLQAQEVRRALRQRVDAAFLPRPLLLLERLPRDALGKLPRAALLDFLRRREPG